MRPRSRRRLLVVLASSALAAGCARPAPAPPPRPAGFLANVQGLRADARWDGALVYRKPGVELSAYDRLLVDPVVIQPAADPLSAEDRDHLARAFRRALERAVGDAYPLVAQPGPGVLRLRAALTRVAPQRLESREGIVTGDGADRALPGGVRRAPPRAGLEAELLDSVTQERLFAVVDRRLDSRLPAPRRLARWGEVEQLIDRWARRLRERLDAWHGRARAMPRPAGAAAR